MLLRFLAKNSESNLPSFALEGRRWSLITQNVDISSGSLSDFTCISYSWGLGRVPNPFDKDLEISDRTIPALLAAMRHRPSCERFWIDALCVPPGGKEKQVCLMSMGLIYNRAKEVVVVLSNRVSGALRQMSISDNVDYDTLCSLEAEEWISRAWTYQEVVNSRSFHLTSEQANDTIVEGSHFLNCIGYSLSLYKKQTTASTSNLPRLGEFEDLVADWMISDYQRRSALQIMSNLDKRTQTRPEDHFYAMIGAVGIDTLILPEGSEDPSEAFMSLCERKGDYSFVYSATERDSTIGRGWRPIPGDIPSILPWHGWGEAQPGHYDETGCFHLDDMITLRVSPLEREGSNFVDQWLSKMEIIETEGISTSMSAYEALRTMGFKGSPHCLSTAMGYFFPWKELSRDAAPVVLVATGVRWVCGAPGLAQIVATNGMSYMPGVFVGFVSPSAATSVKV